MSYYHFQRAAYPYAQPYEDDPKRKTCPALLASINLTGQNTGDRRQKITKKRGRVVHIHTRKVSKLATSGDGMERTHKVSTKARLFPKPIREIRDQE